LQPDPDIDVSPYHRHHRLRAGASAAIVCALAAACGRIGYDPLASELPDALAPKPDAHAPAGGSGGDASNDGPPDTGDDSADATLDGPEGMDAADDGAEPDAADAAAEACAVSSVADYCASLPPLPAPPVIDGVLDCGPALLAIPAVGWTGPSPLPAFPPGNATEIAAAWRPDGLYVFLAVTTPAAIPADPAAPVFYGAGVELFVDDDAMYLAPPTFDNPGTIQLIVTAPSASPDASATDAGAFSAWRAEGFRNAADQGPWASTQFAMFPSAGGFVFEGFVGARDLGLASWTLAAGQHVGLDVAVDVSYTSAATTGPQGHRVGQYFLHIAPPPPDGGPPIGWPFQDPRAFCAPLLGSM
jgi:hypothetical protein